MRLNRIQIATLEIFRRTLWGLLLLEMQTIHITDGDPNFRYSFSLPNETNDCDGNVDESSESTFSVDSSKRQLPRYLPAWLVNQLQTQDHGITSAAATLVSNIARQMDDYLDLNTSARDYLFQAELCVWAGVFAALGIWATG